MSRAGEVINEATRPAAPAPELSRPVTERGQALAQHAYDVHNRLRAELGDALATLEQLRGGLADVALARSQLQLAALRANDWALGGLCQATCFNLTEHHTIEDTGVFPHLRRRQPNLGPVLDRLDAEHHVIHGLLEDVDAALIELARDPEQLPRLDDALTLLRDVVESHFSYEERAIAEPISRYGFADGQI
jgi:hypothetical protein